MITPNHSVMDSLMRLSPVRFVRRVAIYPLIIMLLALGLWLVISPLLVPWLQPFAEFVIQYRSPIRVLTAALALLCASFFFWPRESAELAGRWNNYVGLAFATFFVQYFLRYVDLRWKGVAGDAAIHIGVDILVYLCSGLNNLLFLAAARVLLNKNERVKEQHPFTKDASGISRLRVNFSRALAEFRAALPRWAWVAALFAPLGLLDSIRPLIWARFPDALFSFYCLGWFGYATAINFNVRRRKLLATLALLVSFSYGAGQLVYASNPIIAHTVPPNKVSGFPLGWIRQKFGLKLNDLVVRSNVNTKKDVTPKEFLDSAVYAVLLPMKYALFLPPFFLYLLFIISVNDFRGALSETTNRRKDYLSADGIVRAIGESLSADKVILFIRIPGVQRIDDAEEDRVLPIAWHRDLKESEGSLKYISPIKADGPLLKLLKEQDEAFDRLEPVKAGEADDAGGTSPSERLMVPIKFHGGVIGVLMADLSGYGRFNHTTLQKLKLLADLIAPSVQDFRSLAAADQIGFRLTRLHFDRQPQDFEAATQNVLSILHDLLSSLATGLFLNMGFVPVKQVCPDGSALGVPLEQQARTNKRGIDLTETITIAGESVRFDNCPMFVRTPEGVREDNLVKGPLLGTLGFAIPAEKDFFSRPTLAAYYLNRKTVASLAADGILDMARNYFGIIIKELSVSFSRETLSLKEWFDAITTAVKKAGLLWVVAVSREGEDIPKDPVEIVREPDAAEVTALREQSLSSIEDSREIKFKNLIRLNLARSKYQLWIGVKRTDFGLELTFDSPWNVFLRDMADMADIALDTLKKRQEDEIEKLQVAQYQGVMTIAVTTGTLMHQLVNMIKDQLFATESLEEALADKQIQLDREDMKLLTAMKRSAGQLKDLSEAFKSVTKMEERKPCSVKEAADQAKKLFQVSLMQRKIEFKNLIPPEIYGNVPFHVAAFALANLIGNAKEAIKTNGKILVEAEEDDKFVMCHVTNSGPRICEEQQKCLFQFGHSTKQGHNGWGLYFVSRSLKENGGAINLDTAYPETRFTIRLPKPGPE